MGGVGECLFSTGKSTWTGVKALYTSLFGWNRREEGQYCTRRPGEPIPEPDRELLPAVTLHDMTQKRLENRSAAG